MSIFKSIVIAQKYPVGSEIRNAVDQSYRESQKLLAIAATAALVPMLGAMWFLKNIDLTPDRQADEAQARNEEEEGDSTEAHLGKV